MSKIRLGVSPKNKVRRNDIEFDFRDVQHSNPKLQGKTPLVLYTKDPLTRDIKAKKRWWERTE